MTIFDFDTDIRNSLATDLAARDDSEMFERSFDDFESEYE